MATQTRRSRVVPWRRSRVVSYRLPARALSRTAVLVFALALGSLAGAHQANAASCSGTGSCRDGVRLFATATSDGTQSCPSGQTLHDNPSGPGSICTGSETTTAGNTGNDCLTQFGFLCPGTPLLLPPLGPLYPPAPPVFVQIPPAWIQASANNLPCIPGSQTPNTAVVIANGGACEAHIAALISSLTTSLGYSATGSMPPLGPPYGCGGSVVVATALGSGPICTQPVAASSNVSGSTGMPSPACLAGVASGLIINAFGQLVTDPNQLATIVLDNLPGVIANPQQGLQVAAPRTPGLSPTQQMTLSQIQGYLQSLSGGSMTSATSQSLSNDLQSGAPLGQDINDLFGGNPTLPAVGASGGGTGQVLPTDCVQ
jgi:hypothetical protein